MEMNFEELSKELADMGMRVLMTTIANGKEIAIVEKLASDEPIILSRKLDKQSQIKLEKALDVCKQCKAFDASRSMCMVAEVQIGRLISTKCPIDRW